MAFGKYLKPIPGATGESTNWVNYKTGVKNIFFRTNADNRSASIAIELTHKDHITRQVYFEQFDAFKSLLHAAVGEEWLWESQTLRDGHAISSIGITLHDVSIFDKNDWPKIISFLKPRLIALDEFWADVKLVFEALG